MTNMAQRTPAENDLSIQKVKRAAIIAVAIGTVLTLINQPGAIFGIAKLQILPVILVFFTPFLVVSISHVLGIRAARKALPRISGRRAGFVHTLFSHGIPGRAMVVGLAAGSTNTLIATIANVLAGRGIDQIPMALIIQALTLPIIFGALSQALVFRRTIGQPAYPAPETNEF